MQEYNTVNISNIKNNNIAHLKHLLPLPMELYVMSGAGDIDDIFSGPKVAIVGARKVTEYGINVTKKISYDLAKSGVTIISGLALGVDSLGHMGAVEAGGKTIAVLPSDVNNIYPRSHYQLARKILASRPDNALVSEHINNPTPMRHHFLERNRIIAGLSDAVLITEAAVRSGSLSTARHALDLGIPVMAVPGRIDSSMSQGTNNLIKAGAHLVTSAEDVMAIMGIDRQTQRAISPILQADNDIESEIIEMIMNGVNDTNELIKRSRFDTADVQKTLTMLEIKGVVRSNDYFNWYLV